MAAWFYLGVLVIGIILFYCYHRAGKLVGGILFSAFTGALALLALKIAGSFIPVPLALTPLSTLVSLILGIPGVLLMLIARLL